MTNLAWKKRIRILLMLLALLWMGTIYLLSAQNSTQSSGLSARVIRKLAELFMPSYDGMSALERAALVSSMQHIVRKAAHASAYCLLGFLTMAMIQTYHIQQSTRFFAAQSICLLYAGVDELHQMFVPGRGPSLTDVCIDFSGAVIGTLLAALLCEILRAILRRRQARQRSGRIVAKQ